LTIAIPGLAALHLEHVLLDVNGTLTNRGALLSGVHARVTELREKLAIHLVSADTFGTLDSLAQLLQVSAVRAASGEDKLRRLDHLGRQRCAVIGNGANDVLVLEAAALGFAVIGPEGTSTAALRAADVVCMSAIDALDLLLEPRALSATLRP
ncbi:MAG: HAD family hydrolase, partial [Solirubrobacteraceae bacterium]